MNLLDGLSMSVILIQMSSLKTSSLGIQYKLSQMRQKVLENRRSSCYTILKRLIVFCILLALAAQGTRRVIMLLKRTLIKYFFAYDILNYACLLPVHLAQMNALENDDPVTW